MSQRNPNDYEVGYKKPPKSTQFQKGHLGYKGKRNRQRPIEDVLLDELSKTVTIMENGKRSKVTRVEALVKKSVAGTMTNGDLKGLMKLLKMLPPGKLEEPQRKQQAEEWVKNLFDKYVQAVRGYYSYLSIKSRLGMDPHDFIDMMLAEWNVSAEEMKVESQRRYEEFMNSPAVHIRPNYSEKCGFERDTMGHPDSLYPDEPPPWESSSPAQ